MFNIRHKVIILLVFFVITSMLFVTSQNSCIGTVHTVQAGQNLFRISLNYNVDMNTVAQLNGITDATKIFTGQSLCIPTGDSPSGQQPNSPANNSQSQTTNAVVVTSSNYFVPCEQDVECVPDQTQVHFVDGLNRCVSAKLTSLGLGWTPAEPDWCNWTNILTYPWDNINITGATVIENTAPSNSSNQPNSNNNSNSNEDVGDFNLCYDGNSWAGRCDSDWMWSAGYYYGQHNAGLIRFQDIPNQYRMSSQDSNNNSDNVDSSSKSNNNSSNKNDSGDSGSGDDSSGGDDSGDSGSGDDSGDSGSGDDSGDSGSGDDSGDGGSGDDSGDSGSGDDSGDSGSGDDSGDGGSGDDDSGSTTTAECRNNPSVLPLSSAPSVSDNASGLLTLVNWARNFCGGLSALSLNGNLNTASQRHSQDMADRNYFDHTAPAPAPHGASPNARAQSAGYNSYSGENIAAGNSDIFATFNQWWGSDGHRNNILGNHTEMGFGYAFNASATYRHYNTQMFGRG